MNLAFSDWDLSICGCFFKKFFPLILRGQTLKFGPAHTVAPPTRWPPPLVSSVRSPWLRGCRGERPAALEAPGKRRINSAPALQSGQGQPTRGSVPLRCAPGRGERRRRAESVKVSPPAVPPQSGCRGHLRPQVRALIRLPVSVQRRWHPKGQNSRELVLQRVGRAGY